MKRDDIIWTVLIATLAGLMGNVVAGYVAPVFTGREWLAVALFLLVLSADVWLRLAPPKEEDANRLHKWLQQAQRWFGILSYPQRRFVRLGIVLCLALLVIASIALARPAPPEPLCPPNKVCILIAKFEPEGDKISAAFSAQMITDTRILLDKTETQNFVVRGAPVVHAPEEARLLARQANALLVVWGQVLTEPGETKPLVTVYFQLTDLLGVGEAQGTRPYRVEPLVYDPIGEYCPNCVHLKATQRADIVVQAVAGLVHYAQGRPELARLEFMAALYCSGEPLDKAMVAIIHPTCEANTPVAGWNPGLLYYYTGKALVLQGDYASALDFLQQAAARNEQDPAAWIGIATAYQSWLHQPNPPEAVKALRQAEIVAQNLLGKVKPEIQPVVHYDLGLIYELLKDFPHAQQHYQEAADRFANAGASAYASLIGLSRVQKQAAAIQSKPEQTRKMLDVAVKTLEQVRKLDETLPWAYLDLAQIQRDSEEKAKELLQRAGEVAPDEAYVDITRAELCQQWKDYACAATAYAQALKKRPDSGWLYSKIGEFYLPTNPVLPHQSWTEAERYFRRAATELRPQDPWAHDRLAYVLFNQTAYSESIQQYQRALDLVHAQIEAPDIYCSLGRAQERGGLTNEAEQNYARCARFAIAKQLLDQLNQ